MNHKELDVWNLSVDLVEEVYRDTGKFPHEEKYGLTSQMRRAATSIPSNIAEGAARKSTKELIQFLYIALGSSSELDTQLIIANRLAFLGHDQLTALQETNDRIRTMLLRLIKALNAR